MSQKIWHSNGVDSVQMWMRYTQFMYIEYFYSQVTLEKYTLKFLFSRFPKCPGCGAENYSDFYSPLTDSELSRVLYKKP